MGQLGRKCLKGKNSFEASGSPITACLFTHFPSRLCKLFCLFLVAASLSACFSERWAWNQKLTVVVDTPTGPVSGSSVVEVAWNEVNSVGNYPASYKGEATVLKLADGRYLFALIGESAKHLAFRTIEVKADRMGETLFAEMAASEGKSGAVPRKYYPLLVTFDDINDPASVKRVDPANLAASFGPGYTLKSITLEITDEPVTEGKVETVLGWLAGLEGGYLHGGFTSRGAPLGLSGLDFKR